MKKNITILPILLSLTACSSGGNDAATTSTKTGVFLDSPVINIDYKTETISDVTNSLGEFNYLQGENITFSIGSIDFPTVTAESIITPLSMDSSGATSITTSQVATNIAVLLQSLDSNSNPLDGITIDKDTISTATVQVIFDQPASDFQIDSDVNALMTATSSTLVAENIAQSHATEIVNNLLSGAWLLDSVTATAYSVLVFIDDTRYIIASTNNDEFDAELGITVPVSAEFGTYTWDFTAESFNPTRIGESDGQGGLVGDDQTMEAYSLVFSNSGNTLTLSTPADGGVDATKIPSTNNLIGAWLLSGASAAEYDVLVFIDDTRYIVAHTQNTEFDAALGQTIPVSAEFGTYTWDFTAGSFVPSKIGESDGPGGLVDGTQPASAYTLVLSNSGNTLTLSSPGDGDAVFTRVE